MRLTNHHRSAIIKAALEATFDPLYAAHDQREHELGMSFYEHALPKEERLAASRLKRRWVTYSSQLVFNVSGAQLRFKLKEHVVVPASNYAVGTLELAQAYLATKHHDEKSALDAAKNDARHQLKSLLDSMSTLKMLADGWPEGKPFYSQFASDARLPVPLARDVNALLGLAAA